MFLPLIKRYLRLQRFRNPSADNFVWERATIANPSKNLRFQPQPQMSDDMLNDNFKFWKSLEKYNYNIITGKHREIQSTTVAELSTAESLTAEITTTTTTTTTEAITTTATTTDSPSTDDATAKSFNFINLITAISGLCLMYIQRRIFLRL